MTEKNIFQRILDREIPADIVYEDEHCLAFRDIDPQAPTHVLVIPKRSVASLDDLTVADQELAGHLVLVAQRVAAAAGLSGGYRTVVNCGPDAGQEVPHLHLHVIGGRPLNWPPG